MVGSRHSCCARARCCRRRSIVRSLLEAVCSTTFPGTCTSLRPSFSMPSRQWTLGFEGCSSAWTVELPARPVVVIYCGLRYTLHTTSVLVLRCSSLSLVSVRVRTCHRSRAHSSSAAAFRAAALLRNASVSSRAITTAASAAARRCAQGSACACSHTTPSAPHSSARVFSFPQQSLRVGCPTTFRLFAPTQTCCDSHLKPRALHAPHVRLRLRLRRPLPPRLRLGAGGAVLRVVRSSPLELPSRPRVPHRLLDQRHSQRRNKGSASGRFGVVSISSRYRERAPPRVRARARTAATAAAFAFARRTPPP